VKIYIKKKGRGRPSCKIAGLLQREKELLTLVVSAREEATGVEETRGGKKSAWHGRKKWTVPYS